MSITSNFKDFFQVFRSTNVLYSGAVGNRTISKTLSEGAIIKAKLSSAQTGNIYLTGTYSETLAFSSDDICLSAQLFTTLTGASSTSLTGTMTITSENEQGEPINISGSIYEGFGKFEPKPTSKNYNIAGVSTPYTGLLLAMASANVEISDTVTMDGKTYKVNEKNAPIGLGGITHIELTLQEV